MTSKIGTIQDLHLFDLTNQTLTLCHDHETQAQKAIATAINNLFDTNPLFQKLFGKVLTEASGSSLTIRVTHQDLSIDQPGKKSTLSFESLDESDDSQDIVEKSHTLLRKIDGIYKRCINEQKEHRHAPTTRFRPTALSITPRSQARSHRSTPSSRRSSASTMTSNPVNDAGSRASPLSIRTASSESPHSTTVRKLSARAVPNSSRKAPSLVDASTTTETDSVSSSAFAKRALRKSFKSLTPRFKQHSEQAKDKEVSAAPSPESKQTQTDLMTTELAAIKETLSASNTREESLLRRMRELETTLENIRNAHPKISAEHLISFLELADNIENNPSSELDDSVKELLQELKGAPIGRSIYHNMYLRFHKMHPAEPSTLAERLEIGPRFFLEPGYLGTSLTAQKLNQIRADAIRFAVLEEIENQFTLSVIEEPSSELLAAYDKLPETIRNQIEGFLWQIKGCDVNVETTFGHIAMHTLDNSKATHEEKAKAVRQFIIEAHA